MGNLLTVKITGLDSMIKALKAEDRNQLQAIKKAHTAVSAEAVKKLKDGLSNRFGRKPSDKNYQNSPKGTLPYMHTGMLRKSIGQKILAVKNSVTSKVGSGVNAYPVEYAKYLEGNNHDGIRPFLWDISELYTPARIKAYFDKYYKPFEGSK